MEPSFLGPLCALGSSVAWALGSSSYSKLSRTYSPFSINLARASFALPLFILMTFLVSGGLIEGLASYQRVTFVHWGWFSISILGSYGLGDILFYWSTRSMGVPGALAIASCYPVWSFLAGVWIGREPIHSGQVFGLGFTLLGVVIVVLSGASPENLGESLNDLERKKKKVPWTGLFLAVMASIGWGANSFAVARVGEQLSPSVANTVRMTLAFIFCLGFGRLLVPKDPIFLSRRELFRYSWLFVIEAFLGSLLYVYGLAHSSFVVGPALAALAPVISVPVAVLLKLEKFCISRTLGVIFVVFGVSLLLEVF